MNAAINTLETAIPTFDPQDISLLTELGLVSNDLELCKETPLGQVQLPNAVKVAVWATSAPALFFRFDFQFPDSRQYRAETGSGAFRTFWKTATRFAQNKLEKSDAMFQVTELAHEILERCLRCNTTYRFKATKTQAVDYMPPRQKLVQHIFPEIPAAARAVLAQSHICGICLYQDDQEQQEITRAYIFTEGF